MSFRLQTGDSLLLQSGSGCGPVLLLQNEREPSCADGATFILNGQDAGYLYDRVLSAAAGSFTLTGQDAGKVYDRVLIASAGAFTITCYEIGFPERQHEGLRMPNSFAESADGVVIIADGVEHPLRWDGFDSVAIDAGIVAPTAALTLGSSGSGSLSGTYRAYVRFVDEDGNFSDLSPVSNTATVTNASSITFTSVPVSGEARVARRQILRNTSGQLLTFYVDIDTTDLVGTSFSSTKTDATLGAQTAVPLFATDGTTLANVYGRPPNHKPFVASHLTRMWLGGYIDYAEGSVRVTNGSTTVTGDGTDWKSEFANRYIHVTGGDRAYSIASVNENAQTLTLDEAYDGDTNLFAGYAIRPARAELSLLYFSEAGLPEAWPATNAIELPEDGDQVTGLMSRGSFLYILKRRHVYRLSAQASPAEDGFVFLTANRGCVNHRCWVAADEVAYLLDEGGVYAFDGGDAPESVSSPIQSLFRSDGVGPRINWQSSHYFHAVRDSARETVRWFVCLGGDYLPRHALCFAYRKRAWWIEEFPFPIGASCQGRFGRPTGVWDGTVEQVFLGGPNGQVYSLGPQTLDIATGAGSIRGTITSASVVSLTDASASFATLTNTPVAITSGEGFSQVRMIVSNTGTKLVLDRPWSVLPKAGDSYQIGGIRYEYTSHRLRFTPSEDREGAFAELAFEPIDAEARISLYYDHRAPQKTDISRRGVLESSTRGIKGKMIDLSSDDGSVVVKFDQSRERSTGGKRFVRISIAGVGADGGVVFGEQLINGVV